MDLVIPGLPADARAEPDCEGGTPKRTSATPMARRASAMDGASLSVLDVFDAGKPIPGSALKAAPE